MSMNAARAARRARPSVVPVLLLALALPAAGCRHGGLPGLDDPARRMAAEATRVSGGPIAFEDDFIEARLVYWALPDASPERGPLRARLLTYLLGPLQPLDAEKLRRESSDLGDEDIYDRIYGCLRDAVSLFSPAELWQPRPVFTADERRLLGGGARLVSALFSPRGAGSQVGLSLAIMASLDPGAAEWPRQMDQLLSWTDEAMAAVDGNSMRRATTSIDLLQEVVGDWPAPVPVERLAKAYFDRQQRFASVLSKPLPNSDDARRSLGELLLAHGEDMQRSGALVATLYLRAGLLPKASAETARLAGQPGDDAELRAMLVAAAQPTAKPSDFQKLAQRFLPRVDALGGTSSGDIDPVAAFRVLELGLARTPHDPELLVLSARLARVLASPFLAIRRLEEAQQILEKVSAPTELQAQVSNELLDLYFVRLRLRLDPERPRPAFEEAEGVRRQAAETASRFSAADVKVRDADIDFEVGRSYLNVGAIDQADTLFLRAEHEQSPTDPHAEVLVELGNLAIKRGDPRRAVQLLKDGLSGFDEAHQGKETIGSVEGEARIQRLLGDAYDLVGDRENAERAWRSSAAGWERLMIEHVRRKNFGSSAEAMVELGKLLYVLGRHDDAIQKLNEAVEQEEDRDQTYIDSVAFLVQNGELDAALGIYRRALAKSDSVVSEYVKVYASLWITDLTRRSTKLPDTAAEAFLRTLDRRHPEIRPRRGSAWYRQLAAFAVGRIGYEQLLAQADTNGKRAELYFYEAMRLLADGRADDAHRLWQKVIDTRMFSYFEFDMASRYLRLGAPTTPSPGADHGAPTETI